MTKQLERDVGKAKEGWPAIIFYISMASALSGGLVYLATSPAGRGAVRATGVVRAVAAATIKPASGAAVALPATVAQPPVRFANPFDPSEVFEFPSGTSVTQAQQAVAEVLLQRAHERKKSWSKITYPHRKGVGVAPVRTAGLTRRS
jgi:hypothetical protein